MALGKKPWQGGTRKKSILDSTENESPDYDRSAFDFTSQYRSKREASSTLKGGIILIGMIALGTGFLFLLAYILG